MKNLGPFEIILIVALILLLFGGKKIPELMRGLGQGMNEFKKASSGKDATDDTKNSDTNQSK
jgi:sec-independent protein translocase protein TatA